jgi:osmotically-inducible protein OsmY
MTDQNSIQQEISNRLSRDLEGDAPQVQVDVVDDQVTLAGTVVSAKIRDQAEAIATGTPGVSYVVNNLRVAQEGTTGATG